MNNLNQLHTTKGKFYALHMLFNALYILYRLKIDDNRIAIDRYIVYLSQCNLKIGNLNSYISGRNHFQCLF